MNKEILSYFIYISGIIISSFSQLLLKKAALVKKDSLIKEYLNIKTIVAYVLFFCATLCTVFAYKYIPLSVAPLIGATEYIFIAILGRLFLKEKISKRKYIGLLLILVGLSVYFVF
jgi:drug/metabolite transporter (DMT)-like permease